jgi:hypothetical protein
MEIIKVSQAYIDGVLSEVGQSNASAGFLQLREGKNPTPRTPLYKDLSQHQIFEEWDQILAQYAMDILNKPLIEYDRSRMSKVGPQGGYPPLDDRMDKLVDYYTSPNNDIDPNIINMDLISELRKQLFGDIKNRRPLTPERVITLDKYDDKLITNSGCPDYGKRSDPAIIDNAIRDSKSERWRDYPMILGSRAQRGSDRFIFMAPFSLNIVEKQYLYVLMDIIRSKNLPFFSAWEGFSEVELGFSRIQLFIKYEYLIQQDYKAMDKHVNDISLLICNLICGPIFQKKYSEDFENLLNHTQTVHVMIGLDKIITGKHGMPSGSGMTNFVESIFSYYIMNLYNNTRSIGKIDGSGLGDDLTFGASSNTNITPDSIAEYMSRQCLAYGFVLEESKQRIDKYTTVYLQRFFDKRLPNSGVVLGMYPSILAINTAINPERFHDPRKWNKEMEILRWIMILENCVNLPYFKELVQFFIKGDKYKLGLIIPGFFKTLPSTFEDSKAIKGFVPSYNQEKADKGINDFETVKYLKTLIHKYSMQD